MGDNSTGSQARAWAEWARQGDLPATVAGSVVWDRTALAAIAGLLCEAEDRQKKVERQVDHLVRMVGGIAAAVLPPD